MTRLLVSVRNRHEANVAAEHGADIVDVKEPTHGALGFAGADLVDDILRELDGRVPVSAALGEWREWDGSGPCPVVSGRLAFVKLGLATAAEPLPLNETWQDAEARIRLRISVAARWSDDLRPNWISVAYADHQAAAAPPPEHVLQQAVQSGSGGLLVDTFSKDGRNVFQKMDANQLQQLREKCRRHQLLFTLAGQLTLADAAQIRELAPDIVGVRGAVCEGEQRTAEISGPKIEQFREAIAG